MLVFVCIDMQGLPLDTHSVENALLVVSACATPSYEPPVLQSHHQRAARGATTARGATPSDAGDGEVVQSKAEQAAAQAEEDARFEAKAMSAERRYVGALGGERAPLLIDSQVRVVCLVCRACAVQLTVCFSLFVAQRQGMSWLETAVSGPGGELATVSATESLVQVASTLTRCMEHGMPLIVTDVGGDSSGSGSGSGTPVLLQAVVDWQASAGTRDDHETLESYAAAAADSSAAQDNALAMYGVSTNMLGQDIGAMAAATMQAWKPVVGVAPLPGLGDVQVVQGFALYLAAAHASTCGLPPELLAASRVVNFCVTPEGVQDQVKCGPKCAWRLWCLLVATDNRMHWRPCSCSWRWCCTSNHPWKPSGYKWSMSVVSCAVRLC